MAREEAEADCAEPEDVAEKVSEDLKKEGKKEGGRRKKEEYI